MELATLSKSTSTDLAQKVAAAIAHRKIPATPQNYHVWYNHVSGADEDLSRAINALIHANKPFSETVNAELYKTFIVAKYTDDQIRRMQQEMQNILKDVFENISSVGAATTEYGDHLETSAALFKAEPSADMRSAIRVLADKTIIMARTARDSQQHLKSASTQIESLHTQLKEMEEAVLRDPLTGLYNRKATDQRLREFELAYRETRAPFCVIMADIDHFKKFNDSYGHQVGDAVLRLVGKTLKDAVKGKDFVARYGGEEFIALLPGTAREGAGVVAEQIRVAVQAQRLRIVRTEQEIPTITLSLGIAQFGDADTGETAVHRADQALYFAKKSGRNNVKSESQLAASA